MTVFSVIPLKAEHVSNLPTWGFIRPINQRFIYADELGDDGQLPSAFVHNMERAAVQFNPATDYLVLSGDPIQYVAMSALLNAHYTTFNVLRFERREDAYVPARISSNLAVGSAGVLGSQPLTGVKSSGENSSEGRFRDPQRIENYKPDDIFPVDGYPLQTKGPWVK